MPDNTHSSESGESCHVYIREVVRKRNDYMRNVLLAILAMILIISCDKKKDPIFTRTGILQPLPLDGCTNVIVLDDGTRLEPASNLSGVELQINKRFIFRYRLKPAFSVCMAGESIEIISLRYL
jgi:hypothetical protein